MESSVVSADVFEAITLRNDTIGGVFKLTKDCLQNRGARARGTMCCMVLAALFLLMLPTWLSAMTGYTADIEAFVQDSRNNLIPAEQFVPHIYTIHDGHRLGQNYADEYRIFVPWSSVGMSLESSRYGCPQVAKYNWTSDAYDWTRESTEECQLLWRISEYTAKHGFLGQNDTRSQFTFPDGTNITLDQPSLNVSAHMAVDVESSAYRYSRRDPNSPYSGWSAFPWGTQNYPFDKLDPLLFYPDSETTYNLTQLNERGSCQQLNHVRYKWGFSFLLLYVFIVALLIWTITIYALYLDSYYHSRLDAAGRYIGLKRAVLDLALAMQENLEARDVRLKSDARLSSLVRGYHIIYRNLVLDDLPPPRCTDSKTYRWVSKERWWLIAFLILTALCAMSWTVWQISRVWCNYASPLPPFGVLIVLSAARKWRRRWLCFAFFLTVFLCVAIWWAYVQFRYV